MAKGKWVDVTGVIYVCVQDAAARMRELQKLFPKEKFRVFGHSLSGFAVHRKEPDRGR